MLPCAPRVCHAAEQEQRRDDSEGRDGHGGPGGAGQGPGQAAGGAAAGGVHQQYDRAPRPAYDAQVRLVICRAACCGLRPLLLLPLLHSHWIATLSLPRRAAALRVPFPRTGGIKTGTSFGQGQEGWCLLRYTGGRQHEHLATCRFLCRLCTCRFQVLPAGSGCARRLMHSCSMLPRCFSATRPTRRRPSAIRS